MVLAVFALVIPLRAQDTAKCDLKDDNAYVTRGNQRFNNGNYTGAIDDYTCALELNASNTDALFGRAYAYDASGEDDKAEHDYSRLLEIDPQNSSAYNNRGNIYYARHDYERARADYDRALEYDNTDAFIPYSNRGSLSYDEGDYDAALKDLNKAIELSPTYRAPYLIRAFVYQKLGDDQKSRDDIQSWIQYGETKRIDLDLSTFISGSTLDISEGWIYHIPVEAQAGQTLRAAAKSEGEKIVDPMLVLLDADGTPIAWNDDTEGSLDSLLKYKFTDGGSYELLVTHAGGGSEGEFRLLVEVVSKG
jgi:tetratricopeptide (TPR) repeat protein